MCIINTNTVNQKVVGIISNNLITGHARETNF